MADRYCVHFHAAASMVSGVACGFHFRHCFDRCALASPVSLQYAGAQPVQRRYMATNNKKAPPTDGAGSVLSTQSGPSSSEPPGSLGSKGADTSGLLRKAAASQALSSAMPDNPNLAGQFRSEEHTSELQSH